ncbi:MAG: hypothetical protein DIU78_014165 [Pseudomonadota bacterium]
MSRSVSLSRHFQGLGVALVSVGLAVVSVWVALPRPVTPGDPLPLPAMDRRRQALERAADHERARAAREQPLPYAVRLVGELVRRHGAAIATGDSATAALVRDDLADARRKALAAHGPEPLARLRAVQTELFLAALETYERTGERSVELDELAGNFVATGRRAGWIDESHRVLLTRDDLFVLYRLRWTDLVGALDHPVLGPTLADVRAYYAVLLRHPEGASPRARDAHRLASIAALSRRDPDFPADFARGVLLYRLGEPARAVEAFRRHLATRPDGPWSLRARNYLLASLAEAPSMD